MIKFQLKNRRPIRTNLRAKLLLISFTLIVIPWVGYQYVNTMEDYLRKNQRDGLVSMARAVAAVLNGKVSFFIQEEPAVPAKKKPESKFKPILPQGHLFAEQMLGIKDIEVKGARHIGGPTHPRPNNHVFVRPLKIKPHLDGYASTDWASHRKFFKTYGKNAIVSSTVPYDPNDISFRHTVGSYLSPGSQRQTLYAFFAVKDNEVVTRKYRDRHNLYDQLRITLRDKSGELKYYHISATGYGTVWAYEVPPGRSIATHGKRVRGILGKWVDTTDGYNIELWMRTDRIGREMTFSIIDVDNVNGKPVQKTVLTTGDRHHADNLTTYTIPSPQLENILQSLGHINARTTVIDAQRNIIAEVGQLANQNEAELEANESDQSVWSLIVSSVYQLILDQPTSEFKDDIVGLSRLDGPEIQAALKGSKDAIFWRLRKGERVALLRVAYPVYSGTQVIGAVVIDQSTNNILLLQNKAIEQLINVSFLAFVIAITILLIFATRLSSRVRRLRDDAENAITADGRVTGTITGSPAGDEIGDLSRSIAGMLQRLGHYNRYLESMASKLSHELRTPITVVRSSIDNLEMQGLNDEANTYTQRAREGIDRLSNILTRMSEATRIEQSLQTTDREQFPMDEVVKGCMEGYRIAYPHQAFELDIEKEDFTVEGVPDLIAQMLDKLVSNAIDFSPDDKPIRLGVYLHNDTVVITVANEGSQLPKEMQGNLFDSMVSVREKKGDQVHLGLGLYIVRLIVQYHQGVVSANNTSNPAGVIFTIVLPKTFDPGKRPNLIGVP